MSKVRTRFAPSPTGRMHVGNLRTALYAYLIARHAGGDFILRIEDTDQERQVEGAEEIIYNTLKKAGMNHDEGPDIDGGVGPYVQSERQAQGLYLKYAKELIDKGEAYYCFCDQERLDTLKVKSGDVVISHYDKHCLNLSKEEVQAKLDAGVPYVIRQNNPTEGTTSFVDEIYGEITVDNIELDDMILIKSDGYPTYNFANVVDDHLMGITHVVRGNEYLSSTPKYNRLYDAFGWEKPVYIHCPLITDEEHHKLSKRKGHSSFEDLIEQGFLPETIVNFVALLGWSPGGEQEIFSLKELEEIFDYKHMSKTPAVFDMNKIKWMNGEYIKAMDFDRFKELAMPYVTETIHREMDFDKILSMVKTRIELFTEIPGHIDFFEAVPEYDVEMYKHKKMKTTPETSLTVLKEIYPVIEAQEDFTNDALYEMLVSFAKGHEYKNGYVMWPVRTAVSGKQMTPGGATELMELLGKEESLKRINDAIAKLEAHLHSQLSKAQKEAVMHKDGPMMVLAGPGSGKTLVITKRIQYLISHYQIPPQRILVITFTRAAANEMKERFWRLAGETLPVSFGTFHSVFFTILKYAYHYSADNILPEHKKYDFIREIITDHELEIDDEADFMRQIIQEISLVKGQMIPLAYYHSGCCGDEVFKEIYRAYEEKLHENRWIDFDDILVYTYELLKEREDIRKAWQQKFPYILIDEFQDINKIQYEIVKMLAGETKNLFIVGDDDQSIYKFRGARPELMLNFSKDFENTRQVILNRNYRCGEEIVQVAEDIISYNTKRFEKKMQAREDAASMVEVRTFKDHYEENKHIIYTIKEEMAKKTPLSQIAILYRTNQGPRQLIAALMAYNIPFYMQDAVPNLFDHWISKNIIDYMHLAMGDRKRSTFLRVMNRPKRYISREYLTESQVSFDDLLEKVKDKPWLYEYVEDFKEDLRIMKNMTPLMAINYIRKSVGYNAYLAEYARFRKIQEEEFTQVLEELQESAKGYDTYEAWFDHIKEYTEELNRQSKENQKEKEGVVVSTMHSTKGLEFERVFLPDVNEDVIPHKKSMKEEDVEEERRLFYVGVTRAKKYLHILSVKKLYNKDSRPSRFVEELRSRQEKRGVLHGK